MSRSRVVARVAAAARRVPWINVACAVLSVVITMNVVVGFYERALLFTLVGCVLLLVDDGARLRRRLSELEKTVNEMIEN